MTQLNQASNQLSNKRKSSRHDVSTGSQAALDAAKKQLCRYFMICGMCGLMIAFGFGVCTAEFIMYVQTPGANSMGAAGMLLPFIGFDLMIAFRLEEVLVG